MAATASSQFCPNCPPDEVCEELRRIVRRLVFQKKSETGTRGLAERIMDQLNGTRAGWAGHDEAITNLKRQIAKVMKDFSDNNCGDKAPIGNDAKQWINRPNPTIDELKFDAPAAEEPGWFSMDHMAKVTGLTGGALIAYLIISEGSRLFPPRNLIPVP
ncbi:MULTISPECIES: hypothetical protein [Agrobacterium]|jgi:hypothetical protein|uniref:Uncharacterized protein n=2 Tax=Agrobacterium tumefaciens complex TaxID=1183400 RepID=A0AAW8M2L5_AGRTU|nr:MULTISPECIES: hypothetical protein [Agrobacterium]MBP2540825.1 hypothetical protein [Agrobacterium tumefaciens]MBP2568774.1 hypothetical protein [Agrobacterium tumefaciens]MDR6705572.1 hypothetical protein [Agrobacterium tumefaciens]QXC48609.1 hypothetical protein KHC17_00310 [Agrobacterium salinitolerans]UXS45687.1 hypothetical protein FY149_01190 [Agrobacterium tumefaciens]